MGESRLVVLVIVFKLQLANKTIPPQVIKEYESECSLFFSKAGSEKKLEV
jgi:hypothetical protein